MRDPDGRVRFEGDAVIRHLNAPAGSSHFLHSDLAARWVARGDLVAWEWLSADTLKSPRLPFVTLPSEWTTSQFHAAATLTLKLLSEAVAEGWDMKDASAWNIVFDGLRPVFVDLLSFEPIKTRRWHAAGQFGRHFILPLLLAKKGLMEPYQCLALWRDGVPPQAARKLLGPSRFLTRYWPLMAEDRRQPRQDGTAGTAKDESPDKYDLPNIQRFRARLNQGLSWMLAGVDATKRGTRRSTTWGHYEQQRDHYDEAAITFKRDTIASWLRTAKPHWVLDLGCNAGEFSDLAVDAGAHVICWDGDPQALATLFRRHAGSDKSNLYYPILGPIDDLPGGHGWQGTEFPSLMQRLEQRVDVLLMLAVTHHLAIAGGVHLGDIFRFAACITRKALFVEILSETDPRVQQLCRYYGRDASDFTAQRQLDAAQGAGFRVIQRLKKRPEDTREYVWLERGTQAPD